MATVFDAFALDKRNAPWVRWLPVGLALLAMYVPTYVGFAHTAWTEEHNAHGPLVLVVILWLVWRQRDALAALPERGATLAGSVCLAVGLVLYVLGRALEFVYFEGLSQIPIFAGMLLFIYGWRGVRVMWFPLFYLVFLVPLPGIVVDAATGSLKQLVSVLAEDALYNAGYPVARTGVIITIGQYQLLVADACSGLNSIYSLTALGVLFLYLTWDGGWLRTALMLAAIWPIAFAANVVRVIALVLITYYLGDEAAQGFLHEFSGILLFLVSLFLLFGLNALVGLVLRRRSAA